MFSSRPSEAALMLLVVRLGQLPNKRTLSLLLHDVLFLAYLRKNDKKLAAMIP